MVTPECVTQHSGRLSYEVVVLAGGQGQRMGGRDKGLQVWQGVALVDHVLERLRQQTPMASRILISANRHLDEYRRRAHVVTDSVQGFEGPLRGIQSALHQTRAPYLLVVPCDTPNLPLDLVQRLWHQGCGEPAYAVSGHQTHPLTCLIPTDKAAHLDGFLECDQRRVRTWLETLGAVAVSFPDPEAFMNLNHSRDLEASGPADFNGQ